MAAEGLVGGQAGGSVSLTVVGRRAEEVSGGGGLLGAEGHCGGRCNGAAGGRQVLGAVHGLQLAQQARVCLGLCVLGLGLAHGDPLAQITHCGVLEQGRKHHDETGAQENVYRLDVGNLGQRRIGARHEGCHCEHRGHAQLDASRRGVTMQPEGDPRDDDYKRARDVDLDEVVAHAAGKVELGNEPRVGACDFCSANFALVSTKSLQRLQNRAPLEGALICHFFDNFAIFFPQFCHFFGNIAEELMATLSASFVPLFGRRKLGKNREKCRKIVEGRARSSLIKKLT